MRLLLLGAMWLLLGALLWSTASRGDDAAREPVRRLKEIEQEIRKHADEADAEVKRMRETAKQITKDAEVESAKIRSEADAYTKRIQKEIEEIQKQGPAGWAESTAGLPTRREITDALASLIDPLLACWQPAMPPSAKPKPAAVQKCVEGRVHQRLRAYYDK